MAKPSTIEKQSWEEPIIGMDFSAKIGNSAATISSIVSVAITYADGSAQSDVTSPSQGISGQSITIKLAGGVNGTKYKVTARVIDSDGQRLENDGYLLIKDY